jgi:hypothetical protein
MLTRVMIGYAAWFLPCVLFMAIGEYWTHRAFMHRRWNTRWKRINSLLNSLSYDLHDREHHYKHANEPVRVHIDLPVYHHLKVAGPFIVMFLLGGYFIRPYAYGGALALFTVICLHSYFWTKMHRAIHNIEFNWFYRSKWFESARRQHNDHHLRPNRNFGVVFYPWTDILFRTWMPPWLPPYPTRRFVRRRGIVYPHWESVPAIENGYVVGYQVRWSEPDERGRYLWVGHYYAGDDLSLSWCEVAAASDAKRKNESFKGPWEYRSEHASQAFAERNR